MRILVVGLGEVGSALFKIISSKPQYSVYGYDIDKNRTIHRLEDVPKPIDYLHIAIPFRNTDNFTTSVEFYVKMFGPRMVFIHSTVAPGTTRKLYEHLKLPMVYTPIRGKHPNLERHILFWTKWMAVLPYEHSVLKEAKEHLESLGLKVRICKDPESLELAKLWETVYRALMIAAWQEIHRIAIKFNADIVTIAEFIAEVHEVLKDRPVYYPGFIGGHCLIPNTIILNSVYPSELFEFILKSNEKRLKELENPRVREDVEKLKNIFLSLTNKDYYQAMRDQDVAR